eukprot:TRINITY_DN59595_c0_g2_i1.p1 TRINITY_DN59595_c0_g2~~TRINITY_DN59595_c0_g2_i1.p1  ORF type:complete len:505 (-),score=111.36 TRINITY_DN59595_c0_g2_i1:284-1798(-)
MTQQSVGVPALDPDDKVETPRSSSSAASRTPLKLFAEGLEPVGAAVCTVPGAFRAAPLCLSLHGDVLVLSEQEAASGGRRPSVRRQICLRRATLTVEDKEVIILGAKLTAAGSSRPSSPSKGANRPSSPFAFGGMRQCSEESTDGPTELLRMRFQSVTEASDVAAKLEEASQIGEQLARSLREQARPSPSPSEVSGLETLDRNLQKINGLISEADSDGEEDAGDEFAFVSGRLVIRSKSDQQQDLPALPRDNAANKPAEAVAVAREAQRQEDGVSTSEGEEESDDDASAPAMDRVPTIMLQTFRGSLVELLGDQRGEPVNGTHGARTEDPASAPQAAMATAATPEGNAVVKQGRQKRRESALPADFAAHVAARRQGAAQSKVAGRRPSIFPVDLLNGTSVASAAPAGSRERERLKELLARGDYQASFAYVQEVARTGGEVEAQAAWASVLQDVVERTVPDCNLIEMVVHRMSSAGYTPGKRGLQAVRQALGAERFEALAAKLSL